ncbi:beta-glucosidase family protein [Halostagnicola bangensis]
MSQDSVTSIVNGLTLSEKVSLVHGAMDTAGTATGFIPGVERVGLAPVRLTDGPLGVRTDEPATAFPAPLALASTFDPELAERFGRALGREATARDQDVLLGPGLNLIRVPHCGRNFEYFAEDPVLSGAFAANVVEGIQNENVVATPKHFVANNQETSRADVSAEIEERVLRELYLPAFRDAVEAGAGSIMSSYNRINGTYASEHEYLLTDVLKGEWGFDGFVVSDWFGTESVVGTANGGLDLQMPGISAEELLASMGMAADDRSNGDDPEGDGFDIEAGFDFAEGMPDPTSGGLYAENLANAVERGEVAESRLDDMVTRLLRSLEAVDHFDDRNGGGAIDTPEHRRLAVDIATRGTVLLENDGVLPLSNDADVALVGPNVDEAILGGGGSSEVTPFTETAPLVGMEARADGTVTVARGLPRIEDVSMFEDAAAEQTREPDIEAAVGAASEADVAVVFVRDQATEAADRDSLHLPGRQDELVSAVAKANERTVVVSNTSGPIEVPWRDDVAAIVANWYPGQAHGEAISSVLYGDADPGGRLPVTFAPEGEYPTSDERRFPGVDDVSRYEEGLLVGYRYFDATGVDPTYPFGHGHSYADFEYGDLEVVDDSTVEVTVENVGDRAGREVVQAYVASPDAPDDLERPPRELGGFEAVELEVGEYATVSIDLDERAFGRYAEPDGWTIDAGEHTVDVGRSSRDLRESVTLER